MKKIFVLVLLVLTMVVFPGKTMARSHGHACAEGHEPREAPGRQTPPVALSAPASASTAEPQEERDTRHDWQDRIRENRDRYDK